MHFQHITQPETRQDETALLYEEVKDS